MLKVNAFCIAHTNIGLQRMAKAAQPAYKPHRCSMLESCYLNMMG